MLRYFNLLECNIARVTFEQAVAKILDMAKEQKPAYVITPNADHIVNLYTRPELAPFYTQADFACADGFPIVWASKILQESVPERVCGSDLLPALCSEAENHQLSIFLLGATEFSATKAKAVLQERFPNLKIAGHLCPELQFEKNPSQFESVIQTLNQHQPDFIFMAFGAPRQEIIMHNIRPLLKKGIMFGFGGSIDFISGVQKRAPKWIQNIGFEWLFRLSTNPRRMFMRYLKDFLIFYIIGKLCLQRYFFGAHKDTQ